MIFIFLRNNSISMYAVNYKMINSILNKFWINFEIMFEYLSIFKIDKIDKFFIEYLAESEKGSKKIDRIVDEYYNNVFEWKYHIVSCEDE